VTELEDRLRRLAERGDVRGASAVFDEATGNPAPPSVRSTRVLVLAAVGLIAVLAVGAGLLVSDDAPSDITAQVPPLDGVFDLATGTVLVFDDGLEGTIRVDLDRRTVERKPLDGQRAGDQPFRLLRTGDALVFGWGDVYTAPLSGEPSSLVGAATIFVPALDDGTVWLVDYPGGRIGDGVPTIRHVQLDGTVLSERAGLEHGVPIREVQGGLAYEVDDGIVVWDPATGDTTPLLDRGAFIGDVHGSKVAWCEATGPCREIHVTDLDTGAEVSATPTDPAYAVNFADAAFSPDGTELAVQTAGQILLVDTETGARRVAVPQGLSDAGSLAWRDDGRQLFFASRSYGGTMTEVGVYDVELDTSERRVLPFGGASRFVPVPAFAAARTGERFEPCPGAVDACPTTTTTTTAPSTPPTA
jgi:hypothetical protein